MANRFQSSAHTIAYQFLAARDGESCLLCNRSGLKLEIDHADRNPKNNNPVNLHLMCRACNVKLRNMSAKQQLQKIYGAVCVREKARAQVEGWSATKTIRSVVDYSSGSVEMQASAWYEVPFREWLLENLNTLSEIPLSEAINGGAEYVGCSPVTIRRYLDKLTCSAGILEVAIGDFGKIVRMKPARRRR